jgi:hypothetical protein
MNRTKQMSAIQQERILKSRHLDLNTLLKEWASRNTIDKSKLEMNN